MIRKKIAVALVLFMLMTPFASVVQAGSLIDNFAQVESTIVKLSKLSTAEVVTLLVLFEEKAVTGYEVMFTPSEQANLTTLGVTPATIQAALADFRVQYSDAFELKINNNTTDLLALATILYNIREDHFEDFRLAASSQGHMDLDIFVEILLKVASLELTGLSIPQSVSDNWYNSLLANATNETAAAEFLSDHGVRLSNINAIFDNLNSTDRAEMIRLLTKAGVITTTDSPIGGGPLPPAPPPPSDDTYTYTVETSTVQDQINDPEATEIVITIPETTAPERVINIPTNLVTSAGDSEKPLVLNYGNMTLTLPQGFIPANILSGTTSISLSVTEAEELPSPSDMSKAGQVFTFTLTVNTGNQQTSVTSFAVPITVTIPVGDLNLTTTEMEKIGLYRYSGTQWTYIGGTTDKQTKELSATLNSFSQYRVMLYNKTFTDISTHWAKRTIELLASRHLVAGMTDTTYAPESSLTRAQTATLLVRALNLKPTSSVISFSDVKSGAWYYSTVHTAAQAGLISGYPDGTFKPNQIVSRQEFASMVVRASRAANQSATLTAAEINQILAAYGDTNAISAWAKTDMAYAIHMGLIGGFPDNTIQPVGTSTRAQGAAILERLLRKLNRI